MNEEFYDALDDLLERMHRAATELSIMARRDADTAAMRGHLRSKAEGMRLAISYVEELRRR